MSDPDYKRMFEESDKCARDLHAALAKVRNAVGASPEDDTLHACERLYKSFEEQIVKSAELQERVFDLQAVLQQERSRRSGPASSEPAERDKCVGLKLDAGKPMFHLIPPRSIRQVAAVLTYGAQKYGEGNWKSVLGARGRYLSAAFRHMWAWASGEELDPESGLPHLAHASASLLFLMSGELES